MSDHRPHAEKAARPALAIRDLTVDFARRSGLLRTVDKVSLEVWPKEIVGVIGESGSGKTMTALSAMRLLPHGARIGGAIELGGRDIVNIAEAEMRALRGDRIALIPQDAMQALNPTMPVGRQVGEPFEFHRKLSYGVVWAKVVELLRAVKIADPEIRMREYPHQFSGGMQQRAMIATGLALDPELIIADEPTTALDVTVQARILRLLREIRDERGSAILFITHELGIVAELCDWVYVMKDGKVVEDGPVKRIFEAPRADYTRMLLEATPSIHRRKEGRT
ncbi:MAG TPA: ABC transporter ATP-binding protein [Nordella sp.]|nr:ABC transporter ATP-binding protein [Nordella sp.]